MAELLFPLQIKRQYASPLDPDLVFPTVAARDAYLTNPLRYPGMLVTCLEREGEVFALNAGGNAWVAIAGGAPSIGGLSMLAGADGVSGHRALVTNPDGTVAHATLALADSYVGVSQGATAPGDAVSVAHQGQITEPTWVWTPGLPVFFGDGGVLTQSPPTTICVAHIGVAILPTTILLSKTQPVFIGA